MNANALAAFFEAAAMYASYLLDWWTLPDSDLELWRKWSDKWNERFKATL